MNRIALSVLSFVLLSTSLPAVPFIRGDANGDTVIDLSDAVRVVLHLFSGVLVDCEDALDVDDNESLDITDSIRILNYIFRGGAAPPAPFPAAGTDPAGASLDCER